MKIDIRKRKYNKTKTTDGIHYEVDTDKEYECYEVILAGRYTDINNREELKKKLIKDLQDIIKSLEIEKEEER
jgi:hypothetical protein